MKRHVFTLAPFPSGTTWSIRVPALVHQIVRVLKLRIGEEITLVDGAGGRVEADVVGYSEQSVEVRVQTRQAEETKTPLHATGKRTYVCAAILKKDHFEWLTEKLAELGVTDLLPLVTARTIKKEVRLDRLETIAKEAMEQSEQARVMMIHPPTDLLGAVRVLTRAGAKAVVADTGKGLPSLPDALRSGSIQAVFVGPEGGWSDEERAFFLQECAFERVSLGNSILKGETAGILVGYELIRATS